MDIVLGFVNTPFMPAVDVDMDCRYQYFMAIREDDLV